MARSDVQAWLAAREAGIRPEVAAFVRWAGQPGRAADLAILYLHGFSASPAELRPLPQNLAHTLGANLLALRLTGHGQDGRALAAARVGDWWRDLEQGLHHAHAMGRRVVVLGMSTGAALAALAARDPRLGAMIDAAIFVSPNFALRARGARLLEAPGLGPGLGPGLRLALRLALRLVGDPARGFVPRNARHRSGWTSRYPVRALLPVAALARAARRGDYRATPMPALFVWSDADRIADHRASERVAAGWGGGATVLRVTPGPGCDPDAHVIAGDALSPGMTDGLTRAMADWIRGLP